ncbi:SEC-C domain-containing protein [Vibrio metschnikovii]|uniref:SEC-C domain-containing protein n=1 Tax=bacterium 19CA03SA04 TaxID=2920698 RepID=A0AAU6SXQ9_UNCXX|nr:SEC-C domain-containing protein [Vibrio metschnikovii]EKO3569200.1 SEC-C domain-containing protein [Vibrio metschnikovii]EKO3587129.1 SEC-C domain-containing protein [Vibrio metschnikovii]EKO3596955.1 SEC-C domain-containing protein [Vibrio metschnikovii]EKO3604120.1 SEC-C domain-containing protein [Vibrio metschnikovii]
MKLGRNDPCHCGSGKKFKRSCMSSVSKQHAQVFDDAQAMLAMNPNLSIDELNTALQHKVQDRNNQPHPDFCGVTPTQMANWLYAPFDQLQWVTISTPDSLTTSPVMRYLALILDEAMVQEGSFKATSKGNLPTKLVKQASALLPEFAVAQFERDISISEFAGSNEDKFNALHYTRVLAEISGIIYRRSGRYHVKKEAQKQYQVQGLQAFFKPMLEAAISKYNWGYLDSFEFDVDLRTFWLFMLWRIQSHNSVDQLIDEVMIAFPDLLHSFPADDYVSPERNLSMLIESRFIERFLQFWGFVTMDPRRYINAESVARVVQLQPLLKQTFQFTINT